MRGRSVVSVSWAGRVPPICAAISWTGPSGRGVKRSSQAPQSTRTPARRALVNRSTRGVLPMPASPLIRTARPSPRAASASAASSRRRATSRSRRSIVGRSWRSQLAPGAASITMVVDRNRPSNAPTRRLWTAYTRATSCVWSTSVVEKQATLDSGHPCVMLG